MANVQQVTVGNKKIPSSTKKIDDSKIYNALVAKKPSLGNQDFYNKQQQLKTYVKTKATKNFIAANKEKVRGSLLDYAKSIKDAPMQMLDKLNTRMSKETKS